MSFWIRFPSYRTILLDHLMKRGITHWDSSIKELSAQCLAKIASTAMESFSSRFISELKSQDWQILDYDARYGKLLMISSCIPQVKEQDYFKDTDNIQVCLLAISE